LKPKSEKGSRTYEWILDINAAHVNVNIYFTKAKGLDCFENLLYFTSKKLYMIHVLNLDDGTYTSYYAHHGFFMGKLIKCKDLSVPTTKISTFYSTPRMEENCLASM